jgi:hypothetical protein
MHYTNKYVRQLQTKQKYTSLDSEGTNRTVISCVLGWKVYSTEVHRTQYTPNDTKINQIEGAVLTSSNINWVCVKKQHNKKYTQFYVFLLLYPLNSQRDENNKMKKVLI